MKDTILEIEGISHKNGLYEFNVLPITRSERRPGNSLEGSENRICQLETLTQALVATIRIAEEENGTPGYFMTKAIANLNTIYADAHAQMTISQDQDAIDLIKGNR